MINRVQAVQSRDIASQIKSIREDFQLSQGGFADLVGISKRTLQNWEQGHRPPSGPAEVLISLIINNPEYWFEQLTSKECIND